MFVRCNYAVNLVPKRVGNSGLQASWCLLSRCRCAEIGLDDVRREVGENGRAARAVCGRLALREAGAWGARVAWGAWGAGNTARAS